MIAFHRVWAEGKPQAHARIRVQAFAFEERTPPVELQLWNAGDNPTDYGVHKWTARSSADVLARYESRGNPLLIDVEHNGAKVGEEGEPTITGGYARLELRAGVPWLVFDWSAYAVEQIATGQRRFLSPEYDVDTATGEIVALYRVSLVAEPGTHRARMLAAAINQETGTMNLTMILAALRAALAAEDPAVAKESISNLVAELAKGAGDGGGDAAPPGDAQTGAPADAAPAGGGDQAAAAPPGDGADAGDKDKDKVAAGAAPTTPAVPPVKPAPAIAAAAPADTRVTAAVSDAVNVIHNATRDHLMATEGHRLEPSIRRWASSQPLVVVRGLLSAAPAAAEPGLRVAATRGATQGLPVKPKALDGEQLEELRKTMGTFKATALEPHETATGDLVLPTVPPSVYRERTRAAAAVAIANAGKAGK